MKEFKIMKEQNNLGKGANVNLSELKIEVKEELIDLYPVPISSQSFNIFFSHTYLANIIIGSEMAWPQKAQVW